MKVLFGCEKVDANDVCEKHRIIRVTNSFRRYMRIALAIVFIMTFWAGPYNLLKIHSPKEVIGDIQSYDMWRQRGRNESYEEATLYIEVIIDDEKYDIDMDYVDQNIRLLAGTIDDHLGDIAKIEYIDDWSPLSNRKLLIDLEVDDLPLFDGDFLYSVWVEKAVWSTVLGSVVFVIGLLLYLRETGRFRIIWK